MRYLQTNTSPNSYLDDCHTQIFVPLCTAKAAINQTSTVSFVELPKGFSALYEQGVCFRQLYPDPFKRKPCSWEWLSRQFSLQSVHAVISMVLVMNGCKCWTRLARRLLGQLPRNGRIASLPPWFPELTGCVLPIAMAASAARPASQPRSIGAHVHCWGFSRDVRVISRAFLSIFREPRPRGP